ncbi:hypothetical protein [Amycolatopsis saalfeldensis]|uniref:Uncharacterized protein n=1 Tax=Amycolatopsis saalfeldensis TaxID=394193 RepID=A0A1H8Y340_9PSEU|nr:hypothetical protein [Amycolatopsis saalfeldensis]SEP46496.1 hypothetical protein SAMN04489732_110269 [Amycolatopsis saalfeldensis]
MTAVAIELTRRPPDEDEEETPDLTAALDPDAVQFVGETDDLLVMCACSSSSDQPYQ